jgi:hypothetical protein
MLNGTFGRISSLLLLLCAVIPGGAQSRDAKFISLEQARPVLKAFPDQAPTSLGSGNVDAGAWSNWVQLKDREIRIRLRRGEEDTITNLLRSGVTFTKEVQIDRQSLRQFGVNPAVNSTARHRTDDLISALASPTANEGMQQARELLAQEGYTFRTAQQRARLKRHLLANLARMRDEFNSYRQVHKTAGLAERSHLYEERGISLDSNLWPDYALDRTLRELVQKGLLKPGSVRRVAIVGPGLDFANKDYGNDFYPPQTIQPFAVLDSLARLGLSDLRTVEAYTLDISPNVNIHLRRAVQRAASGKSYVIQLPWDSRVPFDQEYLAGFTGYWRSLGDQIGSTTNPVPVPAEVARDLHIRAVSIRPQVVTRITPVDTNIVFQHLATKKFDLIIGTNIFIYYDAFQQSLARVNLASMLNSGGMVLTNDMLADKVPSHLNEVQRTDINVMGNGAISDHMFCYKRE